MRGTEVLAPTISRGIYKKTISEDERKQLIAELEVLSSLIIDYYLFEKEKSEKNSHLL
jgi:hypothetical protein